ncbi:L-lactate dehydrogenase (quinone) large subunit LdhH [Nitratidesulfovibrio sp. SRB-5]|uniref:L-lactate dehydrogenase (quinone) large subunit LdhH n=1 Tax=Nitratidesulfovibrio sp. SRB-5 TaxID=2872636 RepID=UPI001027CE9B|nr:LUD domain-containing protein [Nitratidesulfovibrio sp. SRB-5]MBZ2171969.1 LUD domain-containing protein [Nitratidesulfovibrio sp. SRB-5]RXF78551.1 4Fe-4S dicluster domain-containing protein [Desulfovibrio sp. DS-1]
MQTAKTLKEYRKELRESLDNEFLREAMDKFATAYPVSRANAFRGLDEKAMIAEVADAKDAAAKNMDSLYAQFKAEAEKRGVKVHMAKDAAEANEIIARIAKNSNCKKIVKSKSMTAEETLLNHRLEEDGLEVIETDLGEWIIQLRHEGPTHMVMPAIHLSRYQVADLFSEVTKQKQEVDIQRLVKVARRELRQHFATADMGISGANFAIAESGTIGLVTNEGNARLVTTLPRVHVALCGLDKLTPSLNDALKSLRVLPRNATGQAITSYVTWITGANECKAAADEKKEMHIVFLDNGRRALAQDPLFSQVMRCVRCGACANVCPVYRLVGGHKMGHIYIGAIGLILTYFFHGKDKARNLVQNCINCESCKSICAGGIDLPRLIKEIRARLSEEDGAPVEATLLGKVLKNRKLFHTLLRFGKFAQKPVTGGTPYLRHLPQMFMKDHGFRALPAIADKAFRDEWETIRPRVSNAKLRVALFSGCVQDFVYPEQMKAAVKVLASRGVEMDFPMDQSCCGLPVQMMAERQATIDVARQNVMAFDAAKYDYILTLCASCASHLKEGYPNILAGQTDMTGKVKLFASKVIDFSSFVHDVLGMTADDFKGKGEKVAYHSSCHLCRGLGVVEQPRALIASSGSEYCPAQEEAVCCGFGGTFSMKFPELSKELLDKKLNNAEATGATRMVADCPGCIMQIRGGAEKRGSRMKVGHIAELLAENLK